MTKLAHQAHNPWTLALTRLISAMPLTIAPALTSARACNIQIEASLWENTAACQLPSDFMQRVSDLTPHDQATTKCIDLKQGHPVFIEAAPLGDFLCVRPLGESFCYWAYTNTVMPDTKPTR